MKKTFLGIPIILIVLVVVYILYKKGVFARLLNSLKKVETTGQEKEVNPSRSKSVQVAPTLPGKPSPPNEGF